MIGNLIKAVDIKKWVHSVGDLILYINNLGYLEYGEEVKKQTFL